MNLNDPIYFHTITMHTPELIDYWNDVHNASGTGGKFYIDILKKIHTNRYVSRNESVWSLPWQQDIIPGHEIPTYDPNFKKSYADIVDERALEIKVLVQQGQKFSLLFSGGIDSTVVLFALIKNLTREELKSIIICSSIDSIMENPTLWKKYVQDKFTVIDSTKNWIDDVVKLGYRPITSEPADLIMGTVVSIHMYHNYDEYLSYASPTVRENLKDKKFKIASGDTHYSIYKDLIIRHLAYNSSPEALKFGEMYYYKYVKCIETSPVPIYSLNDFFWWISFNLKYVNGLIRGPLYFNRDIPKKECMDLVVNWFHTEDFQKWSMANNNNGLKIKNTPATYKFVAREYIKNFDHNMWAFYFKSKLESLGNLRARLKSADLDTTLGLDKNYNMLSMYDPSVREYFKHHMANYKVDWM